MVVTDIAYAFNRENLGCLKEASRANLVEEVERPEGLNSGHGARSAGGFPGWANLNLDFWSVSIAFGVPPGAGGSNPGFNRINNLKAAGRL